MSSASRLRRAAAATRAGAAGSPAARRPRASGAATGAGARLRYAFDSSISRGPSALIAYLGAAVVAVIVGFAAIDLVTGVGATHNPVTAAYHVLLHTIDTGTQANDEGTTYTALNLLVTFAGILIFSAFIGIVATSIDHRLQELRKGRSHVLERDHTLILGWSESIFMIVGELAIANEDRQRPRIVILADRDKVEMEDAVRERVPDLRGTRVVCRSGSPIAIDDLARGNHPHARAVIVLADDDDPDHAVIKTILALTHGSRDRKTPHHIVAEIEDRRNLEIARLAGGEHAVILDKGLWISLLIVQTSRQSGAAAVYGVLLDFDGDEIHMCADASLEGRTYGESLLAYENCSIIGVREAGGSVKLNPPMDGPIAAGEAIVAVAHDDAVLAAAESCCAEAEASAITGGGPRRPERAEATLVLGYNERTPAVIAELDTYALPGARLELMAADAASEEAVAEAVGSLAHLSLAVHRGDTTDRELLDSLDVERFDHVIVMADASVPDRGRADARVLVTLMHVRDIARRRGARYTVVSEILDEADVELASIAEVDDIVVSDQVISYLLAQIAENRDLAEVFAELLEAEGAEVHMRPVEEYVAPGGRVSCATLVAAARQRGETAFGYRVAAEAARPDAGFGVVLNPRKSRTFAAAEGDRLIVLADA